MNHAMFRWTLSVLLVLAIAPGLVLLGPATISRASTTQAPPAIHLLRDHAAPGDYVGVSGSGYTPNTPLTLSVSVYVNGSGRIAQTPVHTDNSGAFTGHLLIPTGALPGSYRIAVTSGQTVSTVATLVVLPLIRIGNGTSKSLSTPVGPSRDFFVKGPGFQPGVAVSVVGAFPLTNGSTVGVGQTVVANSSGVYEARLAVPGNAKVHNDVTLTLRSGSKTGTGLVRVVPVAYLQVGANPPTYGVNRGHSFYVAGTGFQANGMAVVAVTFPLSNGATSTVSRIEAVDASGQFGAVDFHVPGNVSRANITVTATGQATGHQAFATLQAVYQAHGAVSVSPASAAPGSVITIQGTGYAPGDTLAISIPVRLDNGSTQTLSTTAVTSSSGSFSRQIQLPTNGAIGTYSISARSALTGRLTSTHLTITAHGSISLQPANAQPSHHISVQGAGFGANTPLTVSATFPLYGGGSKTIVVGTRSNAQGAVSATLSVPARAAAGRVTITVRGPATRATANLYVSKLSANIAVSPASVLPGATVSISGSGYVAGAHLAISATVKTNSGASQTLTTSAIANGSGQFNASLRIPTNAAGGTYTVSAQSATSGRTFTGHVVVAKLAPSLVLTPTTAVPGTPVTANGFGFPAGATVTLSVQGQTLTTITANSSGAFSTHLAIPSGLATGTYAVVAKSASGLSAQSDLAVNRQVSTHFYFASLYTGTRYAQFLAFLNPTETQARVTITYMRTNGTTLTKTLTVAAHSRATETVATDLGVNVSASATVAADVPIAAARYVLKGSDGAIVPGARTPSTVWYFADGNTSGSYREYIAIDNPNNGPVQVAVHLLPTHHRAFTIYRNIPATARTTVKVNTYVRDAVGVKLTSNGPVVADRTIFIHHGMDSKIGITTPQRTWYFAGGPQSGRYWIGAINPHPFASYATLRAFGPAGQLVGSTHGWIKAHGRIGYLINKIAGRTDVSVALTSSRSLVAEQTSYTGNYHDAATDSFGVATPAKSWGFPAASTMNGQRDILTLFNPSLAPAPVVVTFFAASGHQVQRTYVVGPMAHQRIFVGTVMPSAQLGLLATSNDPFVALNRRYIANSRGSMSSVGVPL